MKKKHNVIERAELRLLNAGLYSSYRDFGPGTYDQAAMVLKDTMNRSVAVINIRKDHFTETTFSPFARLQPSQLIIIAEYALALEAAHRLHENRE